MATDILDTFLVLHRARPKLLVVTNIADGTGLSHYTTNLHLQELVERRMVVHVEQPAQRRNARPSHQYKVNPDWFPAPSAFASTS